MGLNGKKALSPLGKFRVGAPEEKTREVLRSLFSLKQHKTYWVPDTFSIVSVFKCYPIWSLACTFG